MHKPQVYWIEFYGHRRASFWWNENRGNCNLFNLNFHTVELLHDHMLILLAHFLHKFQGLFLSYRSPDLALSISCRVMYNSSYCWGIMTLQNICIKSMERKRNRFTQKRSHLAYKKYLTDYCNSLSGVWTEGIPLDRERERP